MKPRPCAIYLYYMEPIIEQERFPVLVKLLCEAESANRHDTAVVRVTSDYLVSRKRGYRPTRSLLSLLDEYTPFLAKSYL